MLHVQIENSVDPGSCPLIRSQHGHPGATPRVYQDPTTTLVTNRLTYMLPLQSWRPGEAWWGDGALALHEPNRTNGVELPKLVLFRWTC